MFFLMLILLKIYNLIILVIMQNGIKLIVVKILYIRVLMIGLKKLVIKLYIQIQIFILLMVLINGFLMIL